MKNNEYLNNLRHSAAHLLAAAVMELWPDTKRTIGPSIDDGFYFDFEFKNPITDEDLVKIENKMKEIVKKWHNFGKFELSKDDAKKEYPGNEFKHELIDEFSGKGEVLTFYKSGDYWDLCRGGHVEDAEKELKYFKLLSIAGAYWRGSEKNPMLTRIYGTAFSTQKELDEFIVQKEEAKKRDHKILGPKLDLFAFSEKVGSGLPLWTPRGMIVRKLLDDFVWELRSKRGYERVEIPHITKKDLYETSGHWEKFSEELFKITIREGHQFVMKPMNCPHHTQIYDRKQHSYRELPQRYANTTMVYRDEQSGELAGLSRVRSITQDDAHVFCRKIQFKEEAIKIWDIIDEFYGKVGFKMWVRLSMSDPNEPGKYLGEQKVWEEAEEALRQIAKDRGKDVVEAPGEAAFYGPKLDFMTKDSLGREWQIATIQLDMNMPERFNLFCINEDGEKERIVMLHAAIMGSIERYMSILIEHFAGAFPVWLSPEQVRLIPISDDNLNYANEISEKLKNIGIRNSIDANHERMQNKIRLAQEWKIPHMIVIGKKEEAEKQVAVRYRTGEQEVMSLDKFLEAVSKKLTERELDIKL